MSYTYNNPAYNYGNLTIPNGASVTASTGLTYADSSWITASSAATWQSPSGKLVLTGEDADIVINGQSLNKTLKAIQDELGIPGRLVRNEQLEQEFAELKACGERYRELEAKYQEQKRVFDILKYQDQ